MSNVTRPQVMVAAILDAVTASCVIPETGESMVDLSEAATCLAAAIGIVLEINPNITTSKEIREESERLARLIRHQFKFVRAEFERSGQRPWDATPLPLN